MVAYDLAWLRNEVLSRSPDDAGLLAAVEAAGEPLTVGAAYVLFVSAANPNQPGSDWQFARNVVFDDTDRGMVVLDLLQDGRLGGIEFPDQVRS